VKRGEQAFLDWLRKTRARTRDLSIPIGDDAAVIRWHPGYELVVTADAIAEDSHFLSGDPPALVGRKALAVNLSDVAAMGAEPRFAFATAALPRGFAPGLPRALTLGMRRLAAEHGVVLAGGDTITHPGGLVISVTLVGRVRTGRAISRSGARVGDVIAVTGALGGSLVKGRHLRFHPRVAEGRALAKLGPPSAMMDVSDGLLLDLHRLATMSGVGARVFADRVPVHRDAGKDRDEALDRALSEGEDFELLFTMAPARFRALGRAWKLRTPVTAIGEVVAKGLSLVRGGVERRTRPRGFEHR
jgi:thiamine-monophosphate kinase